MNLPALTVQVDYSQYLLQMHKNHQYTVHVSIIVSVFQGLQASVSVPDSVISELLMSLCEVFVTFHGSVDSVRLVST